MVASAYEDIEAYENQMSGKQLLMDTMRKLVHLQKKAVTENGENLAYAEALWLEGLKIQPESLRKQWFSFLNRRDALIHLRARLGVQTAFPRMPSVNRVLKEDLATSFGSMD